MGGRLLKQWLRYPLKNRQDIEDRLDAVEEGEKEIQHAGGSVNV